MDEPRTVPVLCVEDPPAALAETALKTLPPSLARLEREAILSQLIFAALALAHANVFGDGAQRWCRECQFTWLAASAAPMAHGTTCKTGRVLTLLHELTAIDPVPDSKETEPDREMLRRGGGVRPRPQFDTPWVAPCAGRFQFPPDAEPTPILDTQENLVAVAWSPALALRIADCVNGRAIEKRVR